MAKGDDIEERLIRFAVRLLRLCAALPDTPEGRHVRGQLIRSGTAPAPHYAEGRGAESTRDFVHKLKICLKELNESRVWLLIIKESKMLSSADLYSSQFQKPSFSCAMPADFVSQKLGFSC